MQNEQPALSHYVATEIAADTWAIVDQRTGSTLREEVGLDGPGAAIFAELMNKMERALGFSQTSHIFMTGSA